MRSYARNQGGQTPNTVLAQDVAANDETPISEETVASYVNALRKIFVVEDMQFSKYRPIPNKQKQVEEINPFTCFLTKKPKVYPNQKNFSYFF